MEIGDMGIERETLIEIAVSVVGVGLFIAAILLIGTLYSDGGLSRQGALALIGAIVLFVFLMTGIGYWLSTFEG